MTTFPPSQQSGRLVIIFWLQPSVASQHQMAEPQVPDLFLKLKRASKAQSLTAPWKGLKYFPCCGENCLLQRVPPPHIKHTQNLAGHGPGQPAVTDSASSQTYTLKTAEQYTH